MARGAVCAWTEPATITDATALDRFIAAAIEAGQVAVSVHTDSADPMQAQLIGLALAASPGSGVYIPLHHSSSGGLDFAGSAPAQLAEKKYDV